MVLVNERFTLLVFRGDVLGQGASALYDSHERGFRLVRREVRIREHRDDLDAQHTVGRLRRLPRRHGELLDEWRQQ